MRSTARLEESQYPDGSLTGVAPLQGLEPEGEPAQRGKDLLDDRKMIVVVALPQDQTASDQEDADAIDLKRAREPGLLQETRRFAGGDPTDYRLPLSKETARRRILDSRHTAEPLTKPVRNLLMAATRMAHTGVKEFSALMIEGNEFINVVSIEGDDPAIDKNRQLHTSRRRAAVLKAVPVGSHATFSSASLWLAALRWWHPRALYCSAGGR